MKSNSFAIFVSGNLCFRWWGFFSESFRLLGLFNESSCNVRRAYSEEVANEGFRWSAELFRQCDPREHSEVSPVGTTYMLENLRIDSIVKNHLKSLVA
jgi:hypothetical protein